ncbi:MAG: hypothetical protein DMF92_07990 [Acidobacteria bacterium]|nr:MAG: hypothetical protein DMF92_07990 [Acidobacteriota bacterium]
MPLGSPSARERPLNAGYRSRISMIRRLMKVLVAFACGSAVGLSGTFVFAQHVSITATVQDATVAAIAVDSVGNIYATGTTASKLFVTTENALKRVCDAGGAPC